MSSAFRNFLVVFLLALLGFGVIGHIIATVSVPSLVSDFDEVDASSTDDHVSNDTSVSVDNNISSDTPVSGTRYNFAFICLDMNEKLAGVYLVHTNDGYKTCVSVPIPGSALVENNGAFSTLEKLYANEGKDFVLKKLFYLTGCKIDEFVTVCALDSSGGGKSVTQLSSTLKYTYKISKGFDCPNPYYNRGEIDTEESADVNSNEFLETIKIEPGSYALNGKTNDVENDKMLLNIDYNPNAFDIYSEMLTRIINDSSFVGNTSKQTKVLGYMHNKSFRDYSSSGAALYLFNDYVKASFKYSGSGGAWDELREAINTLERKV